MKKTLGCLRKADQDFKLIDSGDRVAVGVSGGKDSLLLLHALSLYRKFSHKNFTVTAVTVTLGLEPFDISGIRALCEELEIPYIVKETQIGEIIFEYRKEKNPCALCAKMRRAVLAKACQESGCNKLALGHHREDVLETLFMSLFYEGRFHTFHPKTLMSRTGITVIRPLVYLPESHVKHMLKTLSLPVVSSPCPANGETKRQEMKELMKKLRAIYPDASERLLHALQQDHYDLWQKDQ
jgi:tRNA(Ile)-lysidine synthase TilS/MesJ